MLIEIDFNSDEAIYMQVRNQIILGIATAQIREGDPLPSVRQMAQTVGINMHTVNKAYSLLRQEGFIQLDRRKGAVVALDVDKIKAAEEMKEQLRIVLGRGCCRDISRDEVHALVDEIFDEYASLEYRRTGSTVSPTGGSRIALLRYRAAKFIRGGELERITDQLRKYRRCFGDDLSAEKRALLDSFLCGGRIRKALVPVRLRQKLVEEVALRLLFLTGKL